MGKSSYDLGSFYSSLVGKVINSVSFPRTGLEKYKKLFNNPKISITDLKAIQNAGMSYNYF